MFSTNGVDFRKKSSFFLLPLVVSISFDDLFSQVKEVSFKEGLLGSKFICVPQSGENIVTDFIPKVQVRKLHQAANQQLEEYKELLRQQKLEENRATASTFNVPATPQVIDLPIEEAVVIPEIAPVAEVNQEDEIEQKLIKLKTLYDKQLITREEYEHKKAAILDSM